MNRRDVFDAWAPPEARWSPWVKPIAFAHIDDRLVPEPVAKPSWVRDELFAEDDEPGYRTSARPSVAVVVDLPGVDGIGAGLALRERGFQPIPLYASLPGPGASAVVPMDGVLRGLLAAAIEWRDRPLPGDAPPAFLLDARRAAEHMAPRPGQFDNRAISFPSDFPSGARLRDAGVRTVVLVQEGSAEPRLDLVPSLLAWKDAGLAMRILRADLSARSVPLGVRGLGPVLRVRLWWRRFGLRGDGETGFGTLVPDMSQGG